MPQMAPLSWLTLFIIFSFTLIIFNTLNYFSYLQNKLYFSTFKKIKTTHLNWKW